MEVVHNTLAYALAVGDWISIAGFAATVTGLAVAIQQIRRTRSATEATQASVSSTMQKLARDELLSLIPALQRVDRELQTAIDQRMGTKEISGCLADWRDNAFALHGLVKQNGAIDQGLKDELISTGKGAAALRSDLPEEAGALRDATKEIRNAISAVCGQLGGLQQELKFSPEEGK